MREFSLHRIHHFLFIRALSRLSGSSNRAGVATAASLPWPPLPTPLPLLEMCCPSLDRTAFGLCSVGVGTVAGEFTELRGLALGKEEARAGTRLCCPRILLRHCRV